MKMKLIALLNNLKHTAKHLFLSVFSLTRLDPNLLIIAQKDVHCEVRSYDGKIFKNGKNKQQTLVFQVYGSWKIK